MQSWENIGETAGRLQAYRLFTTLLLTLPDEAMLRGVAGMDAACAEGPGAEALASFARASAGKPEAEVLREVAVDRAWLLRNMKDEGPLPPYESAYTGGDARSNIAALNRAYADAGYLVARIVHETPDYIGVELSFMQSLVEGQLAKLQAGALDEAQALFSKQVGFWGDHLGDWACAFAERSVEFARTDFYRAVFQMLQGFSGDEASLLA